MTETWQIEGDDAVVARQYGDQSAPIARAIVSETTHQHPRRCVVLPGGKNVRLAVEDWFGNYRSNRHRWWRGKHSNGHSKAAAKHHKPSRAGLSKSIIQIHARPSPIQLPRCT